MVGVYRATTAVSQRGHGSTTELVLDVNEICVVDRQSSFSVHEVPANPYK